MIEPGAQRCRARQDERRVCHSSARDQGRARGLQLLEGLVVARQVDRPHGCCVFFGVVSGECTMTYLRSAEDGWAHAPVRALWKSGAAPSQTLVHLEAISWGGPMPAHPVRCPQIKQMALTAAAEATSVEEPCMHARQTLFVRDRAS